MAEKALRNGRLGNFRSPAGTRAAATEVRLRHPANAGGSAALGGSAGNVAAERCPDPSASDGEEPPIMACEADNAPPARRQQRFLRSAHVSGSRQQFSCAPRTRRILERRPAPVSERAPCQAISEASRFWSGRVIFRIVIAATRRHVPDDGTALVVPGEIGTATTLATAGAFSSATLPPFPFFRMPSFGSGCGLARPFAENPCHAYYPKNVNI